MRKIFLLFITVLIALGLISCNRSTKDKPVKTPAPAVKPTPVYMPQESIAAYWQSQSSPTPTPAQAADTTKPKAKKKKKPKRKAKVEIIIGEPVVENPS